MVLACRAITIPPIHANRAKILTSKNDQLLYILLHMDYF